MTETDCFKLLLAMVCLSHRTRLGWSQEHTAFEGDMSRNYYRSIEKGVPNVGVVTLRGLAVAFGLELSELVLEAERIPDEKAQAAFA